MKRCAAVPIEVSQLKTEDLKEDFVPKWFHKVPTSSMGSENTRAWDPDLLKKRNLYMSKVPRLLSWTWPKKPQCYFIAHKMSSNTHNHSDERAVTRNYVGFFFYKTSSFFAWYRHVTDLYTTLSASLYKVRLPHDAFTECSIIQLVAFCDNYKLDCFYSFQSVRI